MCILLLLALAVGAMTDKQFQIIVELLALIIRTILLGKVGAKEAGMILDPLIEIEKEVF
jgi:hypothetical protein